MKNLSTSDVSFPAQARSFGTVGRSVILLSAVLLMAGGTARAATLLSEGFEGPGYENSGWIVPPQSAVLPDPDYTATPLAGAQSLRCNGVSFVQRPFVNSTEFYAYCQVRWLAWTDFRVILDWLNASQTSAATVYADFGRRIQVIHGGVSSTGSTVISDNTTYHLWVEWTRGTGTDGTMKIFLSTTGIKPATPEASLSNGAGGALAFFDIGPFGNGADVVYDNVILSDSPIGNNPSANAPPGISDIANQSILPNTTLGPINFTIGDLETPAAALSMSASSSNTGLVPNANIALGGSGAARTITIVPVTGQTGATTISVVVSDGTNTATDTFLLNVTTANTPPTISDITNQSVNQDTTLGPVPFTVGDLETAPASLIVTASSSNSGLVPNASIALGGSGTARTLTLSPVAGQSGSALITVSVNDGQAIASDTFTLTVNQTGGNGTFVLEEGFEGPGYENTGWNPSTGVPNPDYATFPLQGQQSLFLAGGSSINRAFTLNTQFGLYCRVRFPDSFMQFSSLFQWWTAGFGSQVASVSTEFGDRLQLTHGTSSATAIVPTIVPNTTYHIWVDWTANSGAGDGTMRLYISEDATKPAGAQANLINGLGMNPAILVAGPYAGGNGVILDSILVSDSPIGSNPGGNASPSISMVPNYSILPNTTFGPVTFNISDPETPASSLVVTASSSNPTLIPNGSITLGGTDGARTITILPAVGELGTANITLQVSDGTNTATDVFTLTVSTQVGGFALDEGFEGPGFENAGWNIGTGSPNADYTTLPLQGAESLFLASGSSINRAFPLNAEFNLYCRAHWPDAFVQFTSIFQWWTAGFGAQVAGVTTEFGDRLQLTHGTANATAIIPTIIPNATYHLWVEWGGNSGAGDGTMRLYISPTAVKPAVPQALLNNGLGSNPAIFVVGPYSGGNGLIVDSLLVSENPIGSNPGQNLPPTISAIPTQTIDEDTATGAIPFTVGDEETSATSLLLTSASSNPALVPPAGIVLGGSGANRTITVTPLPDQFGSADITLRVSDGENTNSTTFSLVVTPLPETPVVAWADPLPIFFATPLGAAQFNATANVPGTFVYSVDPGAVLPVGNDQALFVTFTPDDLANYIPVNASITIDVLPWSHQDVGSVALAGDATLAGTTFTVIGSGVDIWDYADGFHYAYRPWTGDGDIIARVTGIANTDVWAKAGVMFRESLATNSPHAYMAITPGNGAAFQRRLTAASFSLHTPGTFVAAPYWVRLIRAGNKFQGYTSADGTAWDFVGEDTVPMSATLYVGLAVTAHNNTVLSTGTFTDIQTRVPAPSPQIVITSPADGAFVTTSAPVTIDTSVTANGAAISKVQFFDGAVMLGEDDTAPHVFTLNNAALGRHTLLARAFYNGGLIAQAQPVTVTVLSPLPAPWQHQDVGAAGFAGDATQAADIFTITGGGADIWDAADGFHFVHQPWTGNGEIIARVGSVSNTDPWAKAGVMFRESLAAGSPHAFMCVTPGSGSAFQRRPAADSLSLHTPGAFVTAPYWVRLVRVGDQFSGYISADGVAWTLVGTDIVPMSATLHVGLAVTAHNNGVLTTSTLSNVEVRVPHPHIAITAPLDGSVFYSPAKITIDANVAANGHDIATVQFYVGEKLLGETFSPPYTFDWDSASAGTHTLTAVAITVKELVVPSSPVTITVLEPLPAPWLAQDVGAVGFAGSAGLTEKTFTVRGSGVDIWDYADGFHFVYQPWTGPGEIIARVDGITNTDPWAKAGVMFREALTTGSRHAFMAITPGNGSAFQRRVATDGVSSHTAGAFVAAPYWVRLVRIGDVFQGFISTDGATWTLVGTDTVPMSATLYVGLAVTAHNNTVLNASAFSNVDVFVPPPVIAIASPVNGTTFVAPATITVTANVASNGNAIASVQFFSNGALVGEDAAPPYALTRTGVAAGSYSLTTRANYGLGKVVSSAPVNIVVGALPSAPTSLSANPVTSSRINLAWAAGSANHTGFIIERSINGINFSRVGATGPAILTFASTGLSANTLYYYRVRATNAFGSSAYSAVVSARTFLPLVRVNFQPATAAVPAGYLVDAGATFANRGNGYSYGWNVNNAVTARDRNSALSADQRYDTLQHMQVAGAGSTWEISVSNGTYSVFLVAGDASAFDSVYRINVEGGLTVSGTPNTTTRWYSGTRTVTVTDGRLTVSNGTGAVNNKICFIEITQVAPTAPLLIAASDLFSFEVPKLQLELVSRDTFGRVTLRVTGAGPGTFGLETSSDFKNWKPLDFVPDAHGTLSIEESVIKPSAHRFFRAIQLQP